MFIILGYGNIAPTTFGGRLFCILFSLIGIPLTLSVIADMGKLIATSVTSAYKFIRKKCKCFKPPTQEEAETSEKYKWLVVGMALVALMVYISVGGAVFRLWELEWTFFEAFYFCFITMTTIGFGDFVPSNPSYMLVCTIYILVGLALTSTIIELVRRQYAESWERMKDLSGKLQMLSGPLSDTLKKLGEHGAGGEINVDINLLKELEDLKKAINKTSVEMRLKDAESEDDLLKKQPVIQIIIYESNV